MADSSPRPCASLLVPAHPRTLPERVWYAVGMEDKARENRARRAAERQGFTVRKARTRDPLALAFGWHVRRRRREVAHLWDLESLERWLADPASRDQEEGPR